MKPGSRRIGITSTVPVEAIFAAGRVPVDLNNMFINSADPAALLGRAEAGGFPRNYCAWMKGIYGALALSPDIKTVVGVVQGDCGNTTALMDLLESEGLEVIRFAYPADAAREKLISEISDFAAALGTTAEAAERQKTILDAARAAALAIDRMTWEDGLVTGLENHLSLVNTSDFNGDPAHYGESLNRLAGDAAKRGLKARGARLGVVGVPPIVSDLYESIESAGGTVVYNEVQYEFAMPAGAAKDLVGQYADYTYPYGSNVRGAKIGAEIARRGIAGIIHYTQSFCYHQLDDVVIRKMAGVPVLVLEADTPGPMDARSRLRLEAFIETLVC